VKAAVALSGGADSLASLVLLQESGLDLIPFHARFFPKTPEHSKIIDELDLICRSMGLSLHVLNLAREFENLIIKPFINTYLQGHTPNPCALCNRKIKFGLLMDKARGPGAGLMATGHYAGIFADHAGPSLWRGKDRLKDQSYFLSMVRPDVFRNVLFPLRETTKTQVFDLLKQKGITPPQKEESNEICFINDDYREFISQRVPAHILNRPGPVTSRQGEILGTHKGLWRYTQGQRRGLGIAHAHPLYVLEKKLETNTLIVGPSHELNTTDCRAENLNIHVDPDLWPEKVFVQTRYRQKAQEARVKIQDDQMLVFFSKPGDAPAPGQVAAAYSEQGQVLAAGIITGAD
jgi:tRNA-uridine 2-sulfurtransferase